VSTKSYDQYCGIAAALDRVGDRWTLLILRELSFGEQRFTDLRAGLPGIATNLLTERLRDLEGSGLVQQRELPAPAARTVYALTSEGRRILPVLRALAQFGLPFLDDPVEGKVRARTAVYGGLGALLDPAAAAGVDLRMRFDLDGEELWLEVADGRLVRPDRTATPDLVVRGSAAALVELCRGAEPAALEPRLEVAGTKASQATFRRIFRAPEPASSRSTSGA
jgi:DNA-binding HxlR family transcriptional regulator